MTKVQPPTRLRPTAKFAKYYAGAWTVLAGLALAYMTTLALHPGMTSDLLVGHPEAAPSDSSRSAARFATDISGLKQSVGEIQKDMSTLRTAVLSTSARDREVFERLTAVEERVKPAVTAELTAPKSAIQRQAEAKAQKAAERAAAAQATATAKAAATTAAEVVPAEPAAASLPVTVLNAPANPIATGSILAPPAQGVPAPPLPVATAPVQPVTFGPGAVKAALPTSPVALELASGPSVDALRLNWSLLADRHGSMLKNLEPRYTNGGDGQPYQLVAGPIASSEEASRVCAQLKAKKVACRITGFGGNAL